MIAQNCTETVNKTLKPYIQLWNEFEKAELLEQNIVTIHV